MTDRFADIDPMAVTPRWPPRPDQLVVEKPVYDVKPIPLTSIAFVTSRVIKIDVSSIVNRHLISSMNEALNSLSPLISESISLGSIPEVEWSKMRSLDFQETLRSRDALVQGLSRVACTMCAEFDNHVGTFPSHAPTATLRILLVLDPPRRQGAPRQYRELETRYIGSKP
jgi:antiviral helicase SKI2